MSNPINLGTFSNEIADYLALHPVTGWGFGYRYPGFYAWNRDGNGPRVAIHATPGYFAPGEIAIEIIDPTDGRQLDGGVTEDPFYFHPLTATAYVEVMRPLLAAWDVRPGERVMRADVRPDSIPAYKALRGTVLRTTPSTITVAWDCDGRRAEHEAQTCPRNWITRAP